VITFDATYDPADDKLRSAPARASTPRPTRRSRASGSPGLPKQDLFYAIWSPAREDLLVALAGEIDDEKLLPKNAPPNVPTDSLPIKASEPPTPSKLASQSRRSPTASPSASPSLFGHHSERHARRDAEKIENGLRRAVRLWETVGYWQQRAAGAIAHARYLEQPAVRARRIKKLEAELRGYRATPPRRKRLSNSGRSSR